MSKSRFHLPHFHLRGHERKSSPNAHSGTKVDAINSSGQSDLPIGLGRVCVVALESLSEEQLKTEDIYRKESKKKRREELRLKILEHYESVASSGINDDKESNKKTFTEALKMWNCHEIVGAVKDILRCHCPLTAYGHYQSFLSCANVDSNIDTSALIKDKLGLLNREQCDLLMRLSAHLYAVCSFSKSNGVDLKTIARIWAHVFIRKPEDVETNYEDAQNTAVKHIQVTEMIINYFHCKATKSESHSADESQYVKHDPNKETKIPLESKKSRVMKAKKDAIHLLPECQNLYNAVTNDNYDQCFKWLSDHSKNEKAPAWILSVAEYVENNNSDTCNMTDMNGATRFILMTEVLTGFSSDDFSSFVSEGDHGPKFVEIAGRLSLAAEDAIVNERQTIVETIQLKNDDAAKKEMNYIDEISNLKTQIEHMNERLVDEIQNKKRLVKQLNEFPPERMSSLQIANRKLEGLLENSRRECEKLRSEKENASSKFEMEKLQALGQMETEHRAELKRFASDAKLEADKRVAELEQKQKAEIDEIKRQHSTDLKKLSEEHEEALVALSEIHQERLQEAEMEKLKALGIAEVKHKDMQKRLRKEIKRTRLNSNERWSSMKAEHGRIVADMEAEHRKAIQFLQLQLFEVRREHAQRDVAFKMNLSVPYSRPQPAEKWKNPSPVLIESSVIDSSDFVEEDIRPSALNRTKFTPSPGVDITNDGKFVILPPSNYTRV